MMMIPLMSLTMRMKYWTTDIIGDIHGNSDPLLYWASHYNHDILIIAGDAGLLFGNFNNTEICDIFKRKFSQKKVLIIPGNHEDYDQIYALPQTTVFGAKAYKLSNNFYYIARGEILSINNKTFLCIGGADSIDKIWRQDQMEENPNSPIWWQQEQITPEDISRALTNLKPYDNKVDYVVSHEVPIAVKRNIFPVIGGEKTSSYRLWDLANQIKFSMWYCGHLHLSWGSTIGDMNFTVLNINEIEEVL